MGKYSFNKWQIVIFQYITRLKQLLNHGVNLVGAIRLVNNPNACLQTAIETNLPFWANRAIKAGAKIHADYGKGLTALHLAAQMGKIDMVRLLITKYHANINATDHDSKTPLYCAFVREHIDIVHALVQEFQASIDDKNSWGETLLHLAIRQDNVEKVRLLIDVFKINVLITDKFGNTPLHRAVKMGNLPMLRLLIEKYHADLFKKNARGLTPLYIAAKKGHLEIVKYFLSLDTIKKYPFVGKDLAANDNAALQMAAKLGDLDMVNQLLTFNEVIQNVTANNNGALRLAKINTKNTVAARLMEYEAVRNYENNCNKISES